jgi:hypothetical protein
VLETEMARHEPTEKEALRLLVEYNCTLADLPMIPDTVYHANEETLNAAWQEYGSPPGLVGGATAWIWS